MQDRTKEVKECGTLATAAAIAGVVSGIANAPKAIAVIKKAIDKIEGE